MSVGFVILAHENLTRVAQLVRALLREDAVVAVHVDAATNSTEFAEFQASLDSDRLIFVERRACEWGAFSLVEVSSAGASDLLENWPDVSHVCLLSGSCLPVRPIADMIEFLANAPETDFIESVPAVGDAWVKDGLSQERFMLWFPFSWTEQRWLFDKFVDAQRLLGLQRKLPLGLEPHIGSQWWCLSRGTVSAILQDPKRQEYDRFFERSWIPDEGYFQSLARNHSRNIISRPLTFSRFDDQGKPFVFYDDHADYLAGLDAYFARKMWAGADGLYDRFLGGGKYPAEGSLG